MARPRVFSDEHLLQATARVVAREGPQRFTLEQVGAEAGISPAGILKRFGTKRALLLALTRSGRVSVERAFRAPLRASPTEALLAALAGHARHLSTPRELANGLAFLGLDITEPDFRRDALAFFAAFEQGLVELLDAAVAQGELRPHDTRETARALEVAFHGAIIRWGLRQEGQIAEAIRAAASAVLAPLRTTSRRGRGEPSPRGRRPSGAGRASRGT